MDYAIARLAKLKKHNLAGSASHTARTRPTPNADPTKQNIRFIGSTDPTEKLEDLVQSKIEQHKQRRKIRTDGVYCVELLLTASPSYFRPDDPTNGGYYEENRLKEWFQATQKWLKVQYSDRIVRAELHLDEITPHIHAYFVPLDDKGQLRCNHFFDGPKKMREFQDCYSTAVKHLGLERGIKGSVASHQDIKDFYTIVESGRDIESGELSLLQLQAKAADRDRAVKKKSEMEQTALRLAKENEALRTENFQLRSSLRKQADQLRDLPLEKVAWQLGLTKTDGKWKGLEHIINIDGTKFHDFKPGSQKGGGGALDLVMHVNNCNFNEALVWLRSRFKDEGMLRAVLSQAHSQATAIVSLEPVPKFQPPAANFSQWSAVEIYLTQKRGLPKNLVQQLHTSSLIYADTQQNAVFKMRDLKGETVGAFLRGTRGDGNTFMGYTSGTKRTLGWFYIEGGQPTEKVQRVVLCKSPIDALSLATIETQGVPKERTMYLVADSVLSLPVEYLKTIPLVVAAYDNDASGNQIAKEIQELFPQATSKQPNALDWNLELLEQLRLEESERERSEEKRLQEEEKRLKQQEYASAIALSVRLLWQRQITKGEFYNLSLEENVIKLKRVEGEEIAQIPNDGSQPLGIALNKQDVDRFRELQKRLTTGGSGGNSTVEEPSSVEPQPVPRKVDLEY